MTDLYEHFKIVLKVDHHTNCSKVGCLPGHCAYKPTARAETVVLAYWSFFTVLTEGLKGQTRMATTSSKREMHRDRGLANALALGRASNQGSYHQSFSRLREIAISQDVIEQTILAHDSMC